MAVFFCWDMEKMNHFQFEFAFNSNPELMAKFFRMAADGQLGGAPKRINNSRSTIIKSLVGLNPLFKHSVKKKF